MIANLVAYTAGVLVLPHVGWMWVALGLFVLLLIARAAVLRACGRALFGH